MPFVNNDGSNIHKSSSRSHHSCWRGHLSVRTAAHDATGTIAIAYTPTTTTKTNPTETISMSLAASTDPAESCPRAAVS